MVVLAVEVLGGLAAFSVSFSPYHLGTIQNTQHTAHSGRYRPISAIRIPHFKKDLSPAGTIFIFSSST